MNAVDVIVKKRDGLELSQAEIEYFIAGYTAGRIPDYQAAAWAMAVYFQGMSDAETTALTLAMAASGAQLDFHDHLPSGTRVVDKHSSGGVGDKTTLAVAPIVAACGLFVGKMSGRGLSFTGGTIDKLESITGWSPDVSDAAFYRQLRDVGLVIAGQTAELAPADKALYALRDVTGTVPSLPLIAASIMSKKLAAGADAIVLDVKCGRGAFMETVDAAQTLARTMVAIGTRAGREVTALITQMGQPLGRAIGHALEVREAIDALHGCAPSDFQALVEQIAVEMVRLAAPDGMDEAAARDQVRAVIANGAALAKFRAFVAAQGGDVRQVDDPDRLPTAPVVVPVVAATTGTVASIEPRALGLAVVALGGGRAAKGDAIDHRVGLVLDVKVGDRVKAGDPLCRIHAASEADAAHQLADIRAAFRVTDVEAAPLPLLLGRVTAQNMA
jgi:pyrimidine-nucleoside phosphorylase